MEISKGAWVIIAILVIIVVWGLIGANEARDVGVTCDFGIGDNFMCWNWHTNAIGEFQEGIEDYFGNDGN